MSHELRIGFSFTKCCKNQPTSHVLGYVESSDKILSRYCLESNRLITTVLGTVGEKNVGLKIQHIKIPLALFPIWFLLCWMSPSRRTLCFAFFRELTYSSQVRWEGHSLSSSERDRNLRLYLPLKQTFSPSSYFRSTLTCTSSTFCCQCLNFLGGL